MINALIVLFLLTIFYMSITSRIKAYIKILSLQGFLLFLIVFFKEKNIFNLNFIFLSVETLLIKTILIPLFLNKILKKNDLYRESEPFIPNFYSLVISSFILFSCFVVIIYNLNHPLFQTITPLYFGISISTIIISLFIITTKKKIFTHVIGYVMMENGIFLLSLSVSEEMPVIINIGILLDLFIAIFILGLFINKINQTFEGINIHTLTDLKDYGDDD